MIIAGCIHVRYVSVVYVHSQTHYEASVILRLNQSVMEPDEVFVLPGDWELRLLERAKCGLRRELTWLSYLGYLDIFQFQWQLSLVKCSNFFHTILQVRIWWRKTTSYQPVKVFLDISCQASQTLSAYHPRASETGFHWIPRLGGAAFGSNVLVSGWVFTLVWTVNLTLSLSQRASGMSMIRDASLFRSTDTERA